MLGAIGSAFYSSETLRISVFILVGFGVASIGGAWLARILQTVPIVAIEPSFYSSKPFPNVSFKLSSPTNWNLDVDFGIAFDAPRYTLERISDSQINFSGSLKLVGGYVYTDSAANISTSTSTSVPEPTPLLGLIFAAGMLAISRKVSKTKAKIS